MTQSHFLLRAVPLPKVNEHAEQMTELSSFLFPRKGKQQTGHSLMKESSGLLATELIRQQENKSQ